MYPPLPQQIAADGRARHLLALPATVDPSEVEILARSRFAAPRRAAGHGEVNTDDGLQLSRHSTVHGPYSPRGEGFSPGLPDNTAMVFDIDTPRERWDDAPLSGCGDRDGLARAFPAGLPNREEERVVTWLIAAARRLGGSVRLDVGAMWLPFGTFDFAAPVGAGVILTPDPGAAVDLTVYSTVWLKPDACEQVARSVHPGAMLSMSGAEYRGPDPDLVALNPELHVNADAFDAAVLAAPIVLDGYGVTIDLGGDGVIAVEAMGEDHPPLVLADTSWVANGLVRYDVRYFPPDDAEANREFPGEEYLLQRRAAALLIARLVRALWEVTGGEIADEAGFLLNPEDL